LVGQYVQIMTVEANKAAITITVGTGSNRRTLKLNIAALPQAIVSAADGGESRLLYFSVPYPDDGIASGGRVPVRRCSGVTGDQPSTPRE
jgi:hypothetical protein